MRTTHSDNTYKPGDRWIECPRCGFDVRESELTIEYTGKKVCRNCLYDSPETKSRGAR